LQDLPPHLTASALKACTGTARLRIIATPVGGPPWPASTVVPVVGAAVPAFGLSE